MFGGDETDAVHVAWGKTLKGEPEYKIFELGTYLGHVRDGGHNYFPLFAVEML